MAIDMVTKAELYLLALAELEKHTGNILTTAIVTPDGLIMASTASSENHREIFAGYCAATFRRASETMEELSGENIDMLVFESNKYRVVTIRAGEPALLVAMTGKDVNMGMVIIEMQKAVSKIKELLA